jgi:hypothetical protein
MMLGIMDESNSAETHQYSGADGFLQCRQKAGSEAELSPFLHRHAPPIRRRPVHRAP